MKYLLFLLLIPAFACSPSKRLSRLCKKHPELCQTKADTVESIITDTVTVYEDIIIPADSGQVTVPDSSKNIEVKSGRGKATYNRSQGKATLKVVCEEVVIRHVRKQIITIRKQKVITVQKILRVNKEWDRYVQSWIALILLPIAAYLGYRLGKVTT